MKNWWYYHKWYVICGIVLLGILIRLVGGALGFFGTEPDFQIAYVGTAPLPEDTAAALEEAFAALGGDMNGDGKAIVRLNQYVSGVQTDAESAYYQYASEVTLIGDINDCESYFFLLEDPARFQLEYHVLAEPDGSCPADLDYSAEGKTVLWSDCPALRELKLGSYTTVLAGEAVEGQSQDLLSSLSLGRRCFYTERTTENADRCAELWGALTGNGSSLRI